jgi:hypothetical protein
MVGYELRKWLTQDLPSALTGVSVKTQPKDGMDYMVELFNRSGIAGPAQLIYDMWGAGEHNDLFLSPLLGVPFDKLMDTSQKDFEYMLSHSLPGPAQSPVLRELVFGAQQ